MRSIVEMGGVISADLSYHSSATTLTHDTIPMHNNHIERGALGPYIHIPPAPDNVVFAGKERVSQRRPVRAILKRHASVDEADYGREDAHLDQRGIDTTYADANAYVEKLSTHPDREVVVSLMHSPLTRVKETAHIYYDVLTEAQDNGDIPHVRVNEPSEWLSLETTYPAQAYYTRNPKIPKPEVVKNWITDKKEVASRGKVETALYGIIHRLDALAVESRGDMEIDNFLFVSETAPDILLYHLTERGIHIPKLLDETTVFDALKDVLVPQIAHLEEFVLDLGADDAIYGYFRGQSIYIPREELQKYLGGSNETPNQ